MSGEELLQGREGSRAVITHFKTNAPKQGVYVQNGGPEYLFVWREGGRILGTYATPDRNFHVTLNRDAIEVTYICQREGLSLPHPDGLRPHMSAELRRQIEEDYRKFDALLAKHGL